MPKSSNIQVRQDASSRSTQHVTPNTLFSRLSIPDVRPAVILAEILILPLLVVGVGFLVNPDDPLWMASSFPWAWFAPVILALRYGPLAGLGGAGVLLLAWLAINFGHYDAFPKLGFLGGLILVMLVGEFSSIWTGRARRAEIEQHYHQQRLEHLTRTHYLLRLSHDRLAQDLISRPMSMRDALQALRDHPDPGSPAGSQDLLRLLAQYCQLETAALCRVSDGQADSQPVAHIGEPGTIDVRDPLLRQCLETLRLCHVANTSENTQPTRYLIAAPLLDLSEQIYGVLLVEKMPFFSLQEETLQTINLMLGYYTDGLVAQTLAAPLQAKFPTCPTRFAFELRRLAHLHEATGVSSLIVALEFLPRAVEIDLPLQINRLKRSLDENWLIIGPEKQLLVTLMPVAGLATGEGYLNRLENWANEKTGETLSAIGVFPHIMALSEHTPENILQRLQDISDA